MEKELLLFLKLQTREWIFAMKYLSLMKNYFQEEVNLTLHSILDAYSLSDKISWRGLFFNKNIHRIYNMSLILDRFVNSQDTNGLQCSKIFEARWYWIFSAFLFCFLIQYLLNNVNWKIIVYFLALDLVKERIIARTLNFDNLWKSKSEYIFHFHTYTW